MREIWVINNYWNRKYALCCYYVGNMCQYTNFEAEMVFIRRVLSTRIGYDTIMVYIIWYLIDWILIWTNVLRLQAILLSLAAIETSPVQYSFSAASSIWARTMLAWLFMFVRGCVPVLCVCACECVCRCLRVETQWLFFFRYGLFVCVVSRLDLCGGYSALLIA